MIAVIMPKLSLTMEQGTIIRWLKSEGEAVEKEEPLLEIETDKTIMEVESPASGVLGKIWACNGDTVPVAQVIAYVLSPREEPPQQWPTPALMTETSAPEPTMFTTNAVRTGIEQKPPGVGNKPETRVRVSPRARKLANEKGVDLSKLEGTGSGGRITEQDVLSFLVASSPIEGQVISPGRIQRIAAQRLAASFTSAPHFYLTVEAKATKLVEARERLMPIVEEKVNVRLTITDLLIAMVAQALGKHPLVNASWENGKIKIAREVAIGVATSVADGLIVPVITLADQRSLEEIAKERKDLVEKAAVGRLKPEDLEGGTFTLSNLGMYGIDEFGAIINPPQSAILAVGQIAERPVVENGQVVPCLTLRLTLSLDHRVLDGVKGALFLTDLRTFIEEPGSVSVLVGIRSAIRTGSVRGH